MRKLMSRMSFVMAVTGCLCLLQFAGYANTVSEEARRHMSRGEAAMEMAKSPDEYDAAIKEFKDAARLAPDWPEPHRKLALLQEKMGKLKEAVSSLKEYLHLNPNAPDASKVRDHIYKLEYKMEQTLTIPEIIDVLVSLSDKQKWDVTGDCDTYTTLFSRDKGQRGWENWGHGRLSRTSNEVYARSQGGADGPWDMPYEVNGTILKYDFAYRQYRYDQCAVPHDCCDDECITWEMREAEVVSRTLVKITQKVMKNVPRGRPEDGVVKEVHSCIYKAKAGVTATSSKPPATATPSAPATDVNARDKDGNTPLHKAFYTNNTEMAKELISKGADVNAKNNGGDTPLYEAVNWGKKDWVELLIAHGADINTQDNNGNTLLDTSIFFGNKEIVELLIAKGADINAKDKYGHTPLYKAARDNKKGMVELLRKHGAKE